MLKKKNIILFIIFCLFFSTSAAKAQGPTISAKYAIIRDVETGRILWGKNINIKKPMASTTKIMTAILAIEKGNLNEMVTVTPTACNIGGSSIWLKPGEQLTMKELLYGMMLKSGNDAATAVAQHIAGSVPDFVKMMNAKAIEIGAYNTSFANPHGLDDHNHYSTALDLSIIAAYALKIPFFSEIVKTKEITISRYNQGGKRYLRNINKLLWKYPEADGVKTGYTSRAGHCLVASATLNDWQLVSVILKCPSRYTLWNDSIELLEYGFSTYYRYNVVKKNQIIRTVKVKNGKRDIVTVLSKEEINLPLKKGEENKVKVVVDLPEHVKAPVEKNQILGKLRVYLDSKLMGGSDLVAEISVERKTFIDIFYKMLNNWLTISKTGL